MGRWVEGGGEKADMGQKEFREYQMIDAAQTARYLTRGQIMVKRINFPRCTVLDEWSWTHTYGLFDLSISSHVLFWASAGGATNSPSHVLYLGVSYSASVLTGR